jgi:hypothetical protein
MHLIRSNLQKIIRLNALQSSMIDNFRIDTISDNFVNDNFLRDVINIHINNQDLLHFAMLALFTYSQIIFMKYGNTRNEKLINISSYKYTKQSLNQILFIVYVVCIKGIETAY